MIVNLSKKAIHTADRESLKLLLICDKMLDDRSYIIRPVLLQSLNISGSEIATQQRILRERLEASAPEWRSLNTDRRGQEDVNTYRRKS